MIYVLGGEIDLYLSGGNTIVSPSGYGLCLDPSGEDLDLCSVFIGPIVTTDDRVEELPKWARDWFGSDYEARKAHVDIPSRGWKSVGQVEEIVYFRPGRYQDDWTHEFSSPVPLFKSGRWSKIELGDCKVNWRGIVSP